LIGSRLRGDLFCGSRRHFATNVQFGCNSLLRTSNIRVLQPKLRKPVPGKSFSISVAHDSLKQ
jgi:hypothetical protein